MTGLLRRLRELFGRRRFEREAAEELAQHVELLVSRYREAGLDEADARRRATIEIGRIDAAREQVAEGRTGFVLEQIVRETGRAARVLRRSPGLTVLSVLTMGAGIGASALLFSLVDAVVLRPLPYPEPDRLVRIFDTHAAAGVDQTGVASGNVDDWRRRAPAFSGITGFYTMGRTLSTEAGSEVLIGAQVSRDFFSVVGVRPALGRSFNEADWQRAQFSSAAAPIGPDPVVLLSHAIWQRYFGGDAGVIGTAVTIERRSFEIVGVMPEGFAMPEPDVDLWIPWDLSGDRPRDQHYLGAIGRLQLGTSVAEADAQLNRVAGDLGQEYPDTNRGWGVRVVPLQSAMVGDAAGVLWVLFGAVGLVLLVVCANVALLTLMRGLDRADETAVRLALGAPAGRLLREFFMESALLAVAGGALGAVVAAIGLRVLPAVVVDLPRLDEVGFDPTLVVFITGITLLSALLAGVPQAWRRTRGVGVAAVIAGSTRTTDDRRRHAFRDFIAVGQVALAVVLLLGSGLLARSFLNIRATDSGFDPRGVLVAPVFLDAQTYTSGDRVRTYYRELFDRLEALPGVAVAGGATTVPTSPLGPDFARPVWPAGAFDTGSPRVPASVRMVTPEYFRALGLRIAAGRSFDDGDSPSAPGVIMVNETLARQLWPGRRAVGQDLVVDYSTSGTYPYEVVGVVGDMRFGGPRTEPAPEIYLPHAQRSYLILNVVVKAEGDPRALVPLVRATLQELDPQQPAHGVVPMATLLGATYARDRYAMVLLAVFAGATIFLAMIGVYGVLSQRVRERAREVGIRMAMGADAGRVMRWIGHAGFRLLATGTAIGFVAAWIVSGTLEGFLYGVRRGDAATVVGVLALLAVVGLVATLVPAVRATRISPVDVLRGV